MSINNNERSVLRLLYKLCKKFSTEEEQCMHVFSLAQEKLRNAGFSAGSEHDNLLIVERIKRQLKSNDDQEKFIFLCQRLERSALRRHLPSILALFEKISVATTPESSVPQPPVKLELPTVPDNVTVRGPSRRVGHSLLELAEMETPSSHNNLCQSFPQPWTGGTSTLPSQSGSRELPSSQRSPVVINSGLEVMSSDVGEEELIQELLFVFQGIPGKILELKTASENFTINPEIRLSRFHRCMVLRFAEMGWLHNQVRNHRDRLNSCPGLMEKGFQVGLDLELTEYYRLLANIEAQVRHPSGQEAESRFSMLQLQVLVRQPMHRFKWLVTIADACKGRRAGVLASCIHGYMEHGNPNVRSTVKNLLSMVCKPMYDMLSRWMLDGELQDPYEEFFIVANMDVKGDRLWYEKYHVQQKGVPCFITLAQAKKILATGKSINFLREVCHDYNPIQGREQLRQHLDRTSVEALFTLDTESELQSVMDTAYLETSRRVLDVLNGPHMFMENLQALKRYLLLGQGDFIRYFMELLEPELQKPASQLYAHVLSGLLESAIRSTNAQFENPDILQRLDLRLLEQSLGESGWDVFSLDYHVDGPIGTIFGPASVSYLMLFSALWRSKRMEYVLSVSWKRQVTSAKMLRKLPEVGSVLQHTYLLTAEMIHFVHQMQYYMLFEVVECSWHALISDVHQAKALDDVIRAHDCFLVRVKKGILLDNDSQELSDQLRAIYMLILDLQRLEDKFHEQCLAELNARAAREKTVTERGDTGEFGTSLEEESAYTAERDNFVSLYLPNAHAKLRILAKSYKDVVNKFLSLLASHTDTSLQLLSVRLDFNEHYKKADARLAAHYTYRRLSELACKPAVFSK